MVNRLIIRTLAGKKTRGASALRHRPCLRTSVFYSNAKGRGRLFLLFFPQRENKRRISHSAQEELLCLQPAFRGRFSCAWLDEWTRERRRGLRGRNVLFFLRQYHVPPFSRYVTAGSHYLSKPFLNDAARPFFSIGPFWMKSWSRAT